MNDLKKNIAKNLKTLRRENHKTQKQISIYLKIPYSTYAGYENEIALPNLEALIKLSDYYHTTIDRIIDHYSPYTLEFTDSEINLKLSELGCAINSLKFLLNWAESVIK